MLKDASQILHSFLSAVFVFFLLDQRAFAYYLAVLGLDSSAALALDLLVRVPLKVVLASGILGLLVRMASSEEILASAPKFRAAAGRFWKIYVGVAALPVVLHFCFWTAWSRDIPFDYVANLASVFLYYLLARIFVGRLYLKPLHLRRRKVRINLPEAAALAGLYLGSLFIALALPLVPGRQSTPALFLILLSQYLQLIGFISLVLLTMRAYPEVRQHFRPEKEIYLINPPLGGAVAFFSNLLAPVYPPVFVAIKALSPPGYRFREFNRVMWQGRYAQPDKLAAITCFTCNSVEAYQIAKELRRAGSKVVMGGSHVSALPEEALDFCDAVVVGEVEDVWEEVVRDYERGELKKRYAGGLHPGWHPAVFQQLLNSPAHVIKDYLETSRGCRYNCEFCATPYLTERRVRTKPLAEVRQLVEKVKTRCPTIDFLDDNIYADPAYARELFAVLRPLGIKWHAKSSIDIAQDDATLELAKSSGCAGLLIGYEIAGDSGERRQGGKMALAERYLALTDKIKKRGIQVKAHFVLGFDSDDWAGILRLWRFGLRLRPSILSITLLTPMPGSRLFDRMLDEERLTTLNWRRYTTTRLVFRTRRIPALALNLLYPLIYPAIFLTASRLGNLFLLIITLAGAAVVLLR